MATEGPMIRSSRCQAAADLSGKQFYAVKISAANAVNVATTGSDIVYGILQNKPGTDQAADVCISGETKAYASTGIAAGARLMPDASGKLITATTGSYACGQAVEAAAAAGVIFTMKVFPTPIMTL